MCQSVNGYGQCVSQLRNIVSMSVSQGVNSVCRSVTLYSCQSRGMVSVSVNQEVWTVCVGKSMSVSFNGYGSCQSMGMINVSVIQ